jgi:hypothetical protein
LEQPVMAIAKINDSRLVFKWRTTKIGGMAFCFKIQGRPLAVPGSHQA